MNPITRTTGAVAVGVAPTLISGIRNRFSLLVQNLSSSDVYIGGSDVSTLNAPKLVPGADMTLFGAAAVYGISAVAGCDVRYIEEG
jgi:hypothetical protein